MANARFWYDYGDDDQLKEATVIDDEYGLLHEIVISTKQNAKGEELALLRYTLTSLHQPDSTHEWYNEAAVALLIPLSYRMKAGGTSRLHDDLTQREFTPLAIFNASGKREKPKKNEKSNSEDDTEKN